MSHKSARALGGGQQALQMYEMQHNPLLTAWGSSQLLLSTRNPHPRSHVMYVCGIQGQL